MTIAPLLVRPRRTTRARARACRRNSASSRAAMRGHPAHRLRKRVVARLRAVFPQAGVVHVERRHRLFDEMLEQRRQRRILPDHPRIGQDGLEAQHHLAIDVVLPLHVGGVADADRAHAVVAAQVRHDLLMQIALAGDAVDRLQRTAVGHLAQEAHERFAFGQVAQAAQRLDDEGGVAQPAEPIVPGAARADRLGNAGRRRRDDRAGVVEGVQLQAQRRSQHRLGRKRRQRAWSSPTAASRESSVRAPFRRPAPNRCRAACPRSARRRSADRCESRVPSSMYGAGTLVDRYKRVGPPTTSRPCPAATTSTLARGVVGPRIEMHAHARRAFESARSRRQISIGASTFSPCRIRGAKSIDLEAAVRGLDLGAQRHWCCGRMPTAPSSPRPA